MLKIVTIVSRNSGLCGWRRGSDDPIMCIDIKVKKSSHKTNEYKNNNKLVERCKTTQNEKCCSVFVGNIMPLNLYNECLFIDSASNKTVKMVVYSFIHHSLRHVSASNCGHYRIMLQRE